VSNLPMLNEMTPDQIDLIKRTIAKNATDDELKLFLYRAKILGLDPLKPGQIHFVKYNSSPGQIVVGIEGIRSIAARTGKLAGINRGVIKDEQGKLIGAWCEVRRHDWTHPAREEVPFSEFTTGRNLWLSKPETMIKKVAEATALRMAFPDDLGGVYEESEFSHSEPQAKTSSPLQIQMEQPVVADGMVVDTTGELIEEEYRIPFGKWAKRSLDQVYREKGLAAMRDYVTWLEDKAKKTALEKGIPIDEKVQDLIDRGSKYIGQKEKLIGTD
jgi:phage recombination protein Bet